MLLALSIPALFTACDKKEDKEEGSFPSHEEIIGKWERHWKNDDGDEYSDYIEITESEIKYAYVDNDDGEWKYEDESTAYTYKNGILKWTFGEPIILHAYLAAEESSDGKTHSYSRSTGRIVTFRERVRMIGKNTLSIQVIAESFEEVWSLYTHTIKDAIAETTGNERKAWEIRLKELEKEKLEKDPKGAKNYTRWKK